MGRFVKGVIRMCGLFGVFGWAVHSSKSNLIIPPSIIERPDINLEIETLRNLGTWNLVDVEIHPLLID